MVVSSRGSATVPAPRRGRAPRAATTPSPTPCRPPRAPPEPVAPGGIAGGWRRAWPATADLGARRPRPRDWGWRCPGRRPDRLPAGCLGEPALLRWEAAAGGPARPGRLRGTQCARPAVWARRWARPARWATPGGMLGGPLEAAWPGCARARAVEVAG